MRARGLGIYIFLNEKHFESTIRSIVLPNNEKSLSHLVMKTAWEVLSTMHAMLYC